ncbi:polysaccharide export outer membrane protein [Mucilaginibacter frigoritolerans]|jgi:polysaccharide biosynthesis/export protein|uniref:Polysaccharide export outer membrane protein n=1 Tax=Mucilaginibacter frigoritolerans TaxID=652788 RepID=A0A562UFK5_9SPHI|nr:polysaccharide biosynthesis/export family protein [Mucilaginibacter frigoritolerans]TWJ04612.1 polysaccharide export outer membrane protein [Mucilaginibacter frigoritolerans]
MNKSFNWRFFLFTPVIYLSLMFASCSSTKNIKYFADIPDSGKTITIPIANYTEPKIQVDDIMTIVVTTVDPSATLSINQGNIPINNVATMAGSGGSASMALGATTVSGYLVDKQGNVQIPILGEFHLVGLTTEEAGQVIKTAAGKFYKDASVIVRYANFKITVTGEVTRPSVYVMPNEKVSILDALSVAGDLTIYGKRENILLLRDNGEGTKIAYRINLNKSNIMNQPYYYLRQNDFIYVEPTQGKAAANDLGQTRTIAIISSILTVVIVIISRINF